ncbi:MAG: transposase family protein [Deltaproteobacteria bacterium]|nr:transposase family protein [Deltaproteobacteria bacterium]
MATKPKSQQARKLAKQPSVFRRLTGIPPAIFFELCEQVRPLYYQAEEKRLAKLREKRLIHCHVDAQYKLSMEDRLLMLLMYYRLYTTHILLGFLFRIDDSNVGRNINPLQPLLAKFFKIPERKLELGEDEIVTLFLDGTEQKINRPQGPKQKN